MEGHYINTMQEMLKEFDNAVHSDQFYNDLAWEGLLSTDAWSEKAEAEKQRILSVISNFKSNEV